MGIRDRVTGYERVVAGADRVVDAARNLLEALFPILRERCADPVDAALAFGVPRWVPSGEGLGRRYRAVPRTWSAEQQCALRVTTELRDAGELPALAELEGALADDLVVGPRLGHSVASSGAGGGGWDALSRIQILIDRAVAGVPSFNLPDGVRDSLIEAWIELLRRPSDRITVVVTLREFYAEDVRIVVSPGLEIDLLSDDEIAVALTLGGRAGANLLTLDERSVSPTFGIRASFESRLLIDGEPAAAGEEDVAARQAAQDRAALVFEALRVFKAGRVENTGTFQYMTDWGELAAISGSLGPMFGWHAGDPYLLVDEEVSRFLEFWSTFEAVHSRPPRSLRRGSRQRRSLHGNAALLRLVRVERARARPARYRTALRPSGRR
jgi:hypothetical protein